jgi:hypothetical protein
MTVIDESRIAWMYGITSITPLPMQSNYTEQHFTVSYYNEQSNTVALSDLPKDIQRILIQDTTLSAP